MKGDHLREFIFSKNSDYVVYSEGVIVLVYITNIVKNLNRLKMFQRCGNTNVVDYSFEDVEILMNIGGFVSNYKIFSPDGTKIIYPGERFDQYYYNLYLYNTKTKESYLLTNKTEDLMYTYYPPAFYAWVDNNSITYRCNPKKLIYSGINKYGESGYLPDKYIYDEYNLSTYCKMNLLTGEVTSNVGAPINFYDGETNFFGKEEGIEERFTIPYRMNDDCFPNFDKSLCVFHKGKFFIYNDYLIDQLYVKEDTKNKLVYNSRTRPEAIYWSKDDKIYIALGGEVRVVNRN